MGLRWDRLVCTVCGLSTGTVGNGTGAFQNWQCLLTLATDRYSCIALSESEDKHKKENISRQTNKAVWMLSCYQIVLLL